MSAFDIRAEVREVVVPNPPREVVITMPYSVAQSVMDHLATLSGDRLSAWTLFGALKDAGVDPRHKEES